MSKTARKFFEELDEATIDGTEILVVEQGKQKKKVTGFPVEYFDKHITIENPANGNKIVFFRAFRAITVTDIIGVMDAGTSVVLTIKHDTSRGNTGTTVDILTVSSTTTGNQITSGFDDATIPAGSWVWVLVGTVTGAVTQVSLSIKGTVD